MVMIHPWLSCSPSPGSNCAGPWWGEGGSKSCWGVFPVAMLCLAQLSTCHVWPHAVQALARRASPAHLFTGPPKRPPSPGLLYYLLNQVFSRFLAHFPGLPRHPISTMCCSRNNSIHPPNTCLLCEITGIKLKYVILTTLFKATIIVQFFSLLKI